MEQTESGLLVPKGVIEKGHEVWDSYEGKHLVTLAELFMRHHLLWNVACAECKQGTALSRVEGSRDYLLECACKIRRIKMRRKR